MTNNHLTVVFDLTVTPQAEELVRTLEWVSISHGNAIRERDRLKAMIVMRFDHDAPPQFEQGYIEHEMLEPVTAEHCRWFVSEIESLRQQLAASQAREQRLRGWIEANAVHDDLCNCLYLDYEGKHGECSCGLSEALSQPSDTTALSALIAKAGEVMRARCFDSAQAEMDEQYIDSSPWYAARACREAIHAIPGVTLEDLK